MIKKLAKSKTIIFAVLLAALGAVQAGAEAFTPYLTPQAYGLFTLGVAVVVAVLRVLTTTGLADK